MWHQLGKHQLIVQEGVNESHHNVWSTASRHENGDVSMLISNYRGEPNHSAYNLTVQINDFKDADGKVEALIIDSYDQDEAFNEPKKVTLDILHDGVGDTLSYSMPSQSTLMLHFKK
jgi:hypothetical protein